MGQQGPPGRWGEGREGPRSGTGSQELAKAYVPVPTEFVSRCCTLTAGWAVELIALADYSWAAAGS